MLPAEPTFSTISAHSGRPHRLYAPRSNLPNSPSVRSARSTCARFERASASTREDDAAADTVEQFRVPATRWRGSPLIARGLAPRRLGDMLSLSDGDENPKLFKGHAGTRLGAALRGTGGKII
jgi:hypothetical protein